MTPHQTFSPECPYGADDCPKLRELAKLDDEVIMLRESVASLNSTVRNLTWIMGLLITASTGIGLVI